MPRALAASLTLLLAITPGLAQDSGQKKTEDKPRPPTQDSGQKKTDEKPRTPKEQYQAILQEYDKGMQDSFKAMREAKTDQDRAKLRFPQPQVYGKRMLELAEKFPKDPVAEQALSWIVSNVRFGRENDKAIRLLLTEHIQSKGLNQVAQMLGYSPAPEADRDLQAILKKSPHHDVQGQACFALAQRANREAEQQRARAQQEESEAEKLRADAEKKPAEAESLKAKAEKSVKSAQSHKKTAQEKEKEAESLFDRVIKEFADITWYGKKTIGDGAKGTLFEMRNLAIGKTAPDIAGEDIDGKKFKLADYRGKVVLLDFWGNW
jgi:AhpC/TSA family